MLSKLCNSTQHLVYVLGSKRLERAKGGLKVEWNHGHVITRKARNLDSDIEKSGRPDGPRSLNTEAKKTNKTKHEKHPKVG
jgi:hypothetical protein